MSIDLAGFNPAEPRAAGRWTTGGAQGKKAQAKKGLSSHKALLKEKAALEAEAHHLRVEIARARVGIHHGAAGVHRGAKHTKASKAAPAKSSHGVKGGSGGKGGGSGSGSGSGGKGPSLIQQIATLKSTVAKLRVEWAKIQKRQAKR